MSFFSLLRRILLNSMPPRPDTDCLEDASDGIPLEDEIVPLPIEDTLDLHTFAPRETASVVDSYLLEASQRGFSEVRIIHGRGKGVQRRIVRGVLERHPAVLSFADAPPGRGGWGATVVVLKSEFTYPEPDRKENEAQ